MNTVLENTTKMDLNLNVEFLLQIIVYIATLGLVFGKLMTQMENHNEKLDRLEKNQNEKIDRLEKNHNEKIDRLERKQDKHNQLIERVYHIEQTVAVISSEKDNILEKIDSIEDDIEKIYASERKINEK